MLERNLVAICMLVFFVSNAEAFRKCIRQSHNPLLMSADNSHYQSPAHTIAHQAPVETAAIEGPNEDDGPQENQEGNNGGKVESYHIESPPEISDQKPEESQEESKPADNTGQDIQLEYLPGGRSGSGTTTRYWDCCKPSCGWPKNGIDSAGTSRITSPVLACNAQNEHLSSDGVESGCNGGSAFMCIDQTPMIINKDLAYGFAAVKFSDDQSTFCCSCFELTFPSLGGKRMIVQLTNTGGMEKNNFDIAIPGGGLGEKDGCSNQFGGYNGGDRWGGIKEDKANCEYLNDPDMIKGCQFRWDWMGGSSNPTVEYKEVKCPAEIVARTGCDRVY